MSKLATLQILRGIAASFVVVAHALARQGEWTHYPPFVTVAAQYMGDLGVATFFVISGYIMVRTSGDRFGHHGVTADFLRKRLLRIVPLYWMATLLEIALRLRKGGAIDPQHIFGSFFFIPLPVAPGDYMRPLLGVGWTLDYEMFFYVIFALALMFGKRIGLTLLLSVLAGLVLMGAMFKPLTDTGPPHTLFGFWTDPILLLFAAGVILGLIPETIAWRDIGHPILASLGLLAGWMGAILVLDIGFPAPLAWQLGTWLICFLVVALCVFARPPRDSLLVKTGVNLGDSSYALYLFHFFAVVVAEKIWWHVFGESPSILFIPTAYCAAVASAYAIHHLIEANVDRFARRHRQLKAGKTAAFHREIDVIGSSPPRYHHHHPTRRQPPADL